MGKALLRLQMLKRVQKKKPFKYIKNKTKLWKKIPPQTRKILARPIIKAHPHSYQITKKDQLPNFKMSNSDDCIVDVNSTEMTQVYKEILNLIQNRRNTK